MEEENEVMAVRYTAFGIEWDTDGEEISLPTEVEIPEGVSYDGIGNYLSELTGFCHSEFYVITHIDPADPVPKGKSGSGPCAKEWEISKQKREKGKSRSRKMAIQKLLGAVCVAVSALIPLATCGDATASLLLAPCGALLLCAREVIIY